MNDSSDADWLAQLQQLHNTDKAQREAEEQERQRKRQREQAAELMRQCRVHDLLRQMQKALLNGQGAIHIYEKPKEYDLAMALVWNGPISDARTPAKLERAKNNLTVAAKSDSLWVNNQPVSPATAESLKKALLQAAVQITSPPKNNPSSSPPKPQIT